MTRPTTNDTWVEPVNFGLPINTSYHDSGACISVDGRTLYFNSDRPGGIGKDDIVDVQDLIVIAEYLLPVGPEEVNVNEENDGGQVELEQDQVLVVTLESNPTTGYRWEQAENQESYLEKMGEAEFKPSETGEPPLVGARGWEIFRFKANKCRPDDSTACLSQTLGRRR